jgi:hypothetical protein
MMISEFYHPGYPDSLSETLLPAVKTFSNLQIVEIAPDQSRDDLFTPILEELVNRPSLVKLHVNSACTDEINAPLLSKIGGLVSLVPIELSCNLCSTGLDG